MNDNRQQSRFKNLRKPQAVLGGSHNANQRKIERENSAQSEGHLCRRRHGIALWDGTATAKDDKPYNNTYSWYVTMKNGRIVKVVAFFDTIDLADLWKRIPVSTQDNK